jgi:hypothetical protein
MKVFRPVPYRSYRLIATDTEWAVGDGPEIRGPILAILLLLTGRTAGCNELAGPGAATDTGPADSNQHNRDFRLVLLATLTWLAHFGYGPNHGKLGESLMRIRALPIACCPPRLRRQGLLQRHQVLLKRSGSSR